MKAQCISKLLLVGGLTKPWSCSAVRYDAFSLARSTALRMSSESCELYNFVHRKHAYEVTVTVLTTDLESEIFDPLLLQNITSEMEDVEAALRQH